jgi:hypothetical protein
MGLVGTVAVVVLLALVRRVDAEPLGGDREPAERAMS